ncbi:MAG: hypothetical protein V4480_02630 [Patescibacteria group bacterium]
MNLSRNTIVLIICLVIVLGGAFYYFFFYNSGTEPALTSDNTPASDAELSFIALVSKLDPIVFDTSLLADPRFTTRQDIRTTVVPETKGRTDPFAPIR